ncbi:hypothetical protein D3C73_1440330 [compost metagenome]
MIQNFVDCTSRNRKADSLGFGIHRRVDAHHLAVQIKQRSAGIAGVNGGVGLEQVLVVPRALGFGNADFPFTGA